jgi:hypothetical protein
MKGFLTILFLLISSVSFGQGYTYTYVDPCTKKLNTVTIPNGQSSVTMSYLGQARSFTKNELENGTFNSWIYTIQQSSAEPCGEFKGETQKAQNIIITSNIISTLTSVTAVSTMTVTSMVGGLSSQSVGTSLGNSVSNSGESSSPTESKNNKTTSVGINGSSSGTGGSGGSGTGGSGGSGGSGTGGSGGSGTGGSGGSGGSGTGGSGGSGTGGSGGSGGSGGNNQEQPETGSTPTDVNNQDESSGGAGGTTNSIANAADATSSEGNGGKKGGSKVKVGSIIGTGDIVAIRSNEDGSNQFRATMSVTKSNTDNTRARGGLLNFTTAINNSNLTFYGAFTNKKKSNTFIFANSSMVNFNYELFNTTTVLESHRWGKFSLMGGVNYTVGTLAGEAFNNLSAIGGGFYLFNVGKKVTGNLLVLAVYSPFTKFYEGSWWESGTLVVPFSSWDYGISKNFKFNVSFSGTWEVNKSVLQYQILTGGKILL